MPHNAGPKAALHSDGVFDVTHTNNFVLNTHKQTVGAIISGGCQAPDTFIMWSLKDQTVRTLTQNRREEGSPFFSYINMHTIKK